MTKINTQRVFKFYNDAGHGWLAVPFAYLAYALNEEEVAKISSYSYMRGKTAYLEEDCDAGIFMKAWKAKTTAFHYQEKHCDRSPIRSYDYWSSEAFLNYLKENA